MDFQKRYFQLIFPRNFYLVFLGKSQRTPPKKFFFFLWKMVVISESLYCHQRKNPSKYTFIKILLYLILRFTNRNTTFLKLNVNNWHSINKQAKISSTGWKDIVFCLIFGLSCNLIECSSGSNFLSTKNI